jgi:hypothetical protein
VSTPPQGATEELLPYLANGHQVLLEGLGHTGSFFAEQPEASNRLINAFFDSGQIDDSLYTSIVVDFTPEMTLTWLANAIASIMIGLALIMIASLVWMAYHVRTRASFGRPASAALRSVFLIVLGLGGWFLGALIVLTFLPTVPLYSQLTTVVSVGVPIGIGTYLAWVHRDMPSQTRTMGFVVAMGSALVGGWLGFNATDGFLALITTIVGAAALTNLSLILFEVWRERSVREPLRTATPPLAHPSTSD